MILVIKTMKNTSQIVLQNGIYYSDLLPQKDYSQIIIIGEANDSKIPLLAYCSAVTFNDFNKIHSDFSEEGGKHNWKYEWELKITGVFSQPNILDYIVPTSDSYNSVQHCQVLAYIDPRDLKQPCSFSSNNKISITNNVSPKTSNSKSQKNSPVSSSSSTIPMKSPTPLPSNKRRKVGDLVMVPKLNSKRATINGTVVSIKNVFEPDSNNNNTLVLIDQELTIDTPTVGQKKYMATKK